MGGGLGAAVAGSATPASFRQVVLDVEGMMCAACPRTVTTALANVKGVHNTDVTFKPSEAVVRFDPEKSDVEALTSATERAGFLLTNNRLHNRCRPFSSRPQLHVRIARPKRRRRWRRKAASSSGTARRAGRQFGQGPATVASSVRLGACPARRCRATRVKARVARRCRSRSEGTARQLRRAAQPEEGSAPAGRRRGGHRKSRSQIKSGGLFL